MKFVFANKFHYRHRGADIYALDTAALLTRHGHEVAPFAMHDPRNEPTPWSRFFVSAVKTGAAGPFASLKTAGRFLWSFEAARKFGALLDEVRPDVVHVHNIYHQISPSILPVARKRGVPVVLTAHDYALAAPNYALFHDGAICEVTKPDRYWRAVGHRCVRGSRLASALCAFEHSLHRALGVWRDNVDLVIAPSRFVQATLVAYGWPAEKIVHVPHYAPTAGITPVYGGDCALFVGSLSQEKDVATLVRAAAWRPDIPVRVVGDGPEGERLKELAAQLGADNVTFVGQRTGDALAAEYARARFCVVPSAWYEPFGLVVLEAFAHGKPVVAAQIGGLAELIDEGQTGLYTSAGDAAGLAERIAALWDNEALTEEMGRNARRIAEEQYSPELHYRRLMEAYARVVKDVPSFRA
jgi:glycosyltransferase involved in cell wall biosynthesis